MVHEFLPSEHTGVQLQHVGQVVVQILYSLRRCLVEPCKLNSRTLFAYPHGCIIEPFKLSSVCPNK